ncbi:MAG: hypothetical protein FWF94_05810 [Oscillospiraceae bacterium]|nr:hypothetical protein [Oscillospiraceae bacterium]
MKKNFILLVILLIIQFMAAIIFASCSVEDDLQANPSETKATTEEQADIETQAAVKREPIKGQNEFNILFVGNSFTATGWVPGQVAKLSQMYGVTVKFDVVTNGGATLDDNMEEALEKLRENAYDYAVFQDYGGRQFETEVFFADLELLCNTAEEFDIIPVLYNPAWANIDGKPDESFQEELTRPYKDAAFLYNAILVNAADAWVYAYAQHPDIELYKEDDFHANNCGAYFTACVFVSTLFDIQVKDINEDNIYDGEDAIRLGEAAWDFVNES